MTIEDRLPQDRDGLRIAASMLALLILLVAIAFLMMFDGLIYSR